MPRKTLPRLRSVTIKGKEFHRVSVPQPGGGRRLRQAFGQRTKAAMSELVFGKDVELQPHSIDRYGRLVAIAYVHGTDAGLELPKQGLCWVYEKYVGEAAAEIQTRYRDAQAGAQSGKAGLWQDPDPVPPWEWRRSVCVINAPFDSHRAD
jgi:endonuclease YncB( thermonuclease family)